MSFVKLPLLFALLFTGMSAMAYPEYAARYNVISCTACHLSPVGGGPKNVDGKLFGAHGYELNPFLQQDYISADLRALYYYPTKVSDSDDGMGIMQGSVAGHVALDAQQRIHLVIEQNIAGFSAAASRDTYGLIKFAPDTKHAWFESLMVGRFRRPFGLQVDEHRTYTRQQTATEWYTFEVGTMLSGTPSDQWHYDLALVNGENAGGQALNAGQAVRWGGVANVRYMPGAVLLGASGSYHDHTPTSDSRKAVSLYAVISVARMTHDQIPLDINLEHARAWGWDSNLGRGFANSNDYVTALGNAQSQGYLAWLDYWLTPRLVLTYKFDYLTPDQQFPADNYARHGFGVKYYAGPGLILLARTEIAKATPPSEGSGKNWAAQNASYGVLQLEF